MRWNCFSDNFFNFSFSELSFLGFFIYFYLQLRLIIALPVNLTKISRFSSHLLDYVMEYFDLSSCFVSEKSDYRPKGIKYFNYICNSKDLFFLNI